LGYVGYNSVGKIIKSGLKTFGVSFLPKDTDFIKELYALLNSELEINLVIDTVLISLVGYYLFILNDPTDG
jgi:hypothetical protein